MTKKDSPELSNEDKKKIDDKNHSYGYSRSTVTIKYLTDEYQHQEILNSVEKVFNGMSSLAGHQIVSDAKITVRTTSIVQTQKTI